MFRIRQTDDHELIEELDSQAFPEAALTRAEIARNTWWVVWHLDGYPVAYAGARVCLTDARLVFLSRCAVMADWRGLGLQRRLLAIRERWARKQDGIEAIITYTSPDNAPSMRNLIKAKYWPYEAEWCGPAYVYWKKELV